MSLILQIIPLIALAGIIFYLLKCQRAIKDYQYEIENTVNQYRNNLSKNIGLLEEIKRGHWVKPEDIDTYKNTDANPQVVQNDSPEAVIWAGDDEMLAEIEEMQEAKKKL